MKDHYPPEKFSAAVRTLALGSESLQERIANAFANSLHLLLDHQGLAPDVAQKLRQYKVAWRAVTDPGPSGSIQVWATRLSDDDAMEIARWIVDTASELDRQFWSDAR